MNQKVTGKFIATIRKDRGLTQSEIAEQLNITDRAVSKWETGKNMPDVSIMQELCDILGISVNELLSGEHIATDDYKKLAERNLLELSRQEEIYNRRMLSCEILLGCISTISFLMLIYDATISVSNKGWRIAMIMSAWVIFAIGIGTCLKIERATGYYECPNCGERYVPTMKSVLLAPHWGFSRKMKCLYCGQRGYHKKVLTK